MVSLSQIFEKELSMLIWLVHLQLNGVLNIFQLAVNSCAKLSLVGIKVGKRLYR